MAERWIPKVGDGATLHIYTDSQAFTVIAVSKSGKTITMQRDKATRTNREDDEFYPGGFFGHTECPKGQQWAYERDPNGEIIKATWRERVNTYKQVGHPTLSPGLSVTEGRHERYDYNF